MKIILLVISLFLLSSFVFAESIPVEVVEIIDGDTAEVKMQSGNRFSLRLIGIDCFEAYNNHRVELQANENNITAKEVLKKGKESREYLKKLKNNAKTSSFDFKGIDKYSRVLGILYFDNININQKLIDKGYCKVFHYIEK
ncbi:MAG: thermonuclease family protein [Cyanobacteria bacterium SIG27]|nr:thermonuclease family protein [Cyanobacteria bacterium SIG27]